MANRNLTLAIEADLLDKARILAAIRRTSVNEMVRQFLQAEVQRELDFETARAALLKVKPTNNVEPI